MDINGKYKSWDAIMYEYNLTGKEKFRWLQLVHTIPKLWIEALNKDLELSINLAIYDHNLIKTDSLYTQDKLVRRSYTIFHFVLCTSKTYFTKLPWKITWNSKLELEKICILPRKVSIDANLRMFQYKILNNILFLNKLPFRFKKDRSPLCSFCNSANETPLHIFYILILQSDYGTSFSILFLGIFIFLKSLHRVPSSDSLISAINNRIFYLLLIFMELFVY